MHSGTRWTKNFMARSGRSSRAMLVVVLAAAALAGCGGRSQSAADGGAQAPTWVKAYSYAGGPLTLKATSQAPDGSQYALVTQPECSGSTCNDALAVARIDPAGNVMWVRRPVGTVSGELSTTPADVPRQRLVAPLPDGGAWIVGGRNEQTAAGADVETARLERLTADGAIAQTLPLPENHAPGGACSRAGAMEGNACERVPCASQRVTTQATLASRRAL